MRQNLAKWLGVLVVTMVVTEVTEGAGASDEAMDVLKKAAAAAGKVELVSYKAEFAATGWVREFVPTIKGTTVLGTPSKWGLDKFYCDVVLTPSGESESSKLAVGSNGDVFFLIDSKTKMAHEDMDSAVLGSRSRDLQRLLLRDFTNDAPFEDALKSESAELHESQSIGGVACHQVFLKSSSSRQPDVTWYIGKKDSLPRKIVRSHANRNDPDGERGTTSLTITDLIVNPKLKKDPFVLAVPAGFTKTDDFAP